MSDLPLSALLSHAFVAYTIELDNEFERRMPHCTTRYGRTDESGPWLVSLAMYFNCMRFVGEEGIAAKELCSRAGTGTNLNGMLRWGYIAMGPNRLIRATRAGLRAQGIWAELLAEREAHIESLKLLAMSSDPALPDTMPILGYGLWTRVPPRYERSAGLSSIPALLAKALTSMAVEFEANSPHSLAITANILRVLDEKGANKRELAREGGVSEEAVAVALGLLAKSGDAAIESGRARLTDHGLESKRVCLDRRAALDRTATPPGLRPDLEALIDRLSAIEPGPANWRSKLPRPKTLPHFPMVLHRGGFPDGS